MKMKYFLAAYTIVMGVLLFLFPRATSQVAMLAWIFDYNEQCILAEKAISEGRAVDEVEGTYQCEILYADDGDYQIRLWDALQREASSLLGEIWRKQEKRSGSGRG